MNVAFDYKRGKEFSAQFMPKNSRNNTKGYDYIEITTGPDTRSAELYHAIDHEILHSITLRELRDNPIFSARIQHLMNLTSKSFNADQKIMWSSLRDAYIDATELARKGDPTGWEDFDTFHTEWAREWESKYGDGKEALGYALLNPGEFISEIFSNPDVQHATMKVKYRDGGMVKNLFQDFRDAVASLFPRGQKFVSVFEQAIAVTAEHTGMDKGFDTAQRKALIELTQKDIDIAQEYGSLKKAPKEIRAEREFLRKQTEGIISGEKPKVEKKKRISDEVYQEALTRLKGEVQNKLFSGVPITPGVMKEFAKVMYYHAERIPQYLDDFNVYSQEMLREFGKGIEPKLKELWDNFHGMIAGKDVWATASLNHIKENWPKGREMSQKETLHLLNQWEKKGSIRDEDIPGLRDWVATRTDIRRADVMEFIKREQMGFEVKEYGGSKEEPTKYNRSAIRLPGGENYKERVFGVPLKKIDRLEIIHEDGKWFIQRPNKVRLEFDTEENARKYATQIDDAIEKEGIQNDSHFPDVPNALGWERVDERTLPSQTGTRSSRLKELMDEEIKNGLSQKEYDEYQKLNKEGTKIKFIDELQESDWVKKARENKESPYKVYNSGGGHIGSFDTEQKAKQFIEDTYGEGFYPKNTLSIKKKETVTHPLLSQTKQLILKDSIHDAVERGMEGLGWNTGENVGKRYSLQDKVDKIWYQSGMLRGEKNGEIVFDHPVDFKDVPQWIGKDTFEKLKESNDVGGYSISGKDLNIQAKWPMELYDKMIPRMVKELSDKNGWNLEIKDVKDSAGNLIHYVEFTPKLKADITLATLPVKGMKMFKEFDSVGAEKVAQKLRDLEVLKPLMNEHGIVELNAGLNLPPELKEFAMEKIKVIGKELSKEFKDFDKWFAAMDKTFKGFIPLGDKKEYEQMFKSYSTTDNTFEKVQKFYAPSMKKYGSEDVVGYSTPKEIPITDAVDKMMKQTVGKKSKSFLFTDTAHNVFRQIDAGLGTDLYSAIFDTMNHAKTEATKRFTEMFTNVVDIGKELSSKEVKDIALFGYAKNKEGLRVLTKVMGEKIPAKLNPRQQRLYEQILKDNRQLFDELNVARTAIGEEPLKDMGIDYMTFGRVLSNHYFDEKAGSLLTMTQSAFQRKYETAFKYDLARKKTDIPLDLDVLKTYKRYLKHSLDYIYKTPVLTNSQGIVNYKWRVPIPGEWKTSTKKGVTSFVLDKNEKKVPATEEMHLGKIDAAAMRYLNEYLVDEAGNRKVYDLFGSQDLYRKVSALKSNIIFSTLGGLASIVLKQPAAAIETMWDVRPDYVAKGIANYFTEDGKNLAFGLSNVLHIRNFNDIAFSELASEALLRSSVSKGMEKVRTAREFSTKFIEMSDRMSSAMTWLGSFYEAREKMGMNAKDAAKRADETVLRIQGSAEQGHISKLQKNAYGRLLTVFNTFGINRFSYYMQDIARPMTSTMTMVPAMGKLLRVAVVSALINSFYNRILGMSEPGPAPVDAYLDEKDKGKKIGAALEEALTVFPVLGMGVRFPDSRFGAVGSYLNQGMNVGGALIRKGTNPNKKFSLSDMQNAVEFTGKTLGVPGTVQGVGMWRRSTGKNKKDATARRVILGGTREDRGVFSKKTLRELSGE